jgi:hypothetical protein
VLCQLSYVPERGDGATRTRNHSRNGRRSPRLRSCAITLGRPGNQTGRGRSHALSTKLSDPRLVSERARKRSEARSEGFEPPTF